MEKVKKNLGLGSLIAGFMFLFNPDVSIVDILPDFIGYLFIVAGLTQISPLNEDIEDARKCFVRAALLNCVKFLLIFVLFGASSSNDVPVSLLLYAFVMDIFDLIFIVPGYVRLFKGIMYLGERLDSDYVLYRKPLRQLPIPEGLPDKKIRKIKMKNAKYRYQFDNAKSTTEKIRKMTLVFVIVKAIGSVLPETPSLIDGKSANSGVNYYDFIGLYRIFSIFIVSAVGVVWLLRIINYFIRVIKDKKFIGALTEKYNSEILPNNSYFIRKYIKRLFLFLGFGCFACIDFYIDDAFVITDVIAGLLGYLTEWLGAFTFIDFNIDSLNSVPDFLAAILFIIAASQIKRCVSRKSYITARVCSWVYLISSVVYAYKEGSFNSRFAPQAIFRRAEAYDAYIEMIIFTVIQGICFIAVSLSLILLVREIVKSYTGYYTKGYDSINPEEKARELHSELMKPFVLVLLFTIISAGSGVLYWWGVAGNMRAMWIIDMLATTLFAVLFVYGTAEISKQIDNKFMLS